MLQRSGCSENVAASTKSGSKKVAVLTVTYSDEVTSVVHKKGVTLETIDDFN